MLLDKKVNEPVVLQLKLVKVLPLMFRLNGMAKLMMPVMAPDAAAIVWFSVVKLLLLMLRVVVIFTVVPSTEIP